MENWSRPVTNLISDIPIQEAPPVKKGSPWSGLGRILSQSEWDALGAWRKENPDLRFRMGDWRGGFRFWLYARRHKCGEIWYPEERFASEKAKSYLRQASEKGKRQKRDNHARNYSDPSVVLKLRKRCRDYAARARQDPERKEAMLQRTREWRANNKGKVREQTQKRWATKKKATHAECDPVAIKKLHGEAFSLGAPREYDVDHIIPLSAGGPHHHRNAQVLPKTVNCAKHAKVFWMSSEYLDFRDVPKALWPTSLVSHYTAMLRIFGHPLKTHGDIP